jgi:hypothetical protein
MAIVGFNFFYDGNYKPETFRFYKHLRGFLRWHRGSAAWIKGGVSKRSAYLILERDLIRKAVRLMSQQLEQGGRFLVRIINPYWIARQTREEEREVLGWISADGISLGDSRRTFCPQNRNEEVNIEESCQRLDQEYPCPCWTGGFCNYPRGFESLKRRVAEGGPIFVKLPRSAWRRMET